MLDGHGRQEGVGNQVALRARLVAQAAEDPPVIATRSHRNTVRPAPELLGKAHGFRQRARRHEDLRVRDDAHETADDQVAQPEGGIGVDDRFQPASIGLMVMRILAVCVNER